MSHTQETPVEFDDDLFDAEIIVRRWGRDLFDAYLLGQILGSPNEESARQRVQRGLAAATIPPAALPGEDRGKRDRWTKEQVVAIVAERLRKGDRVCVVPA